MGNIAGCLWVMVVYQFLVSMKLLFIALISWNSLIIARGLFKWNYLIWNMNPNMCCKNYKIVSRTDCLLLMFQFAIKEMRPFEEQLYTSFSHGVSSDTESKVWTFWKAMFFCTTITYITIHLLFKTYYFFKLT